MEVNQYNIIDAMLAIKRVILLRNVVLGEVMVRGNDLSNAYVGVLQSAQTRQDNSLLGMCLVWPYWMRVHAEAILIRGDG